MFYDRSAVESVELKKPYIVNKKINKIHENQFVKKVGMDQATFVYMTKRKLNPITPSHSIKRPNESNTASNKIRSS